MFLKLPASAAKTSPPQPDPTLLSHVRTTAYCYRGSEAATNTTLLSSHDEADRLHACKKTVKLFYEEHPKYGCYSENWGSAKGADHYEDVCVVLNGTAYKAFKNGALRQVAPRTRNKLYVACSRPRGNLYLISDQLFKKFKGG